MVARCTKTLTLGVCVSTAVPKVGDYVPHVKAGVGAIATQANTNILYGIEGLQLLQKGFSPLEALETMLDGDQEKESRQVIIIDKDGKTAAFTGNETVDWAGHLIGDYYVAAGNMLVGSRVIEAMVQAIESPDNWLAERLLRVLEAGQEAGGDKRGKMSAALIVASLRREKGPILDLRVDEDPEPIRELRRIYEEVAKKRKS